MQTLILTIIVLGVLVFVHELGHFVTAKWVGIAVPRFSIGLGPRLVGVRVGGTDYCLSAIPFGGYVKMVGMEAEEAFESIEGGGVDPEEEDYPPEKHFRNKSIRSRLLVISAGVAMNFLLGWGIYVGVAYMGGFSVPNGTHVAGVNPAVLASYPELEPLAAGGRLTEVDGNPVSNWFDIVREIVEGTDPTLVLTLDSGRTIELEGASRNEIAGGLVTLVPAVIGEVERGGPADQSGLRAGDRIVEIDGVEMVSFTDIVDAVRDRPAQPLPLVVERPGPDGSRRLSLTVMTGSQKAPRPSDAKFVDTGWLGITSDTIVISLGFTAAFGKGTRATGRAALLIVGGAYQVITGKIGVRSLGGPVAIGQLTGHFARQGYNSLLSWVALFSINLALLNLLPIPVLDGGHILFLGIEATRGRPLSTRQKMRLSQAGLAFIVLLMAWAFASDILRLIGV
jgi:regulator of sigma E protease